MTHDYDETKTPIGEYKKTIQTNNTQLYYLRHNNICEIDGNSEIIDDYTLYTYAGRYKVE